MDEKILSDRAFVDEYLIATRDPIPNFFGDTIKFCAYILLSLSFSFLAVYPIIISMTEDILSLYSIDIPVSDMREVVRIIGGKVRENGFMNALSDGVIKKDGNSFFPF